MIRSYLDHTPRIHASAWVDEQATVIGQVSIGKNSSIWPQVVIRGDIQRIEIGASSNIQDGSVLHVTHDSKYTPGGSPLLIGDNVTVGHNATLHACTIGDGCLIGMGSIVLDKAIVAAGAMLGAGTLVPPGKTLEGGFL
ncbi:MAG TPA: gamma carbonic anhydrase family protein, partial [Gammaproteobacteria bacterium]|nr:gamma carbonic anhydrase family protein [Gammaproteobacteria bacterium]